MARNWSLHVGRCWQQQAAASSCQQQPSTLAAAGCFWLLLAASSCCQLLLAVAGSHQPQHTATHRSPWQAASPNNCPTRAFEPAPLLQQAARPTAPLKLGTAMVRHREVNPATAPSQARRAPRSPWSLLTPASATSHTERFQKSQQNVHT